MEAVRPKKSLGQNFLKDKNIIKKIVNSSDIESCNVLEIGPGMGSLTEELVGMCKRLYVVELDIRAIEYLEARFPASEFPQLTIIHSDIRKIHFGELIRENNIVPTSIRVIGNIPYMISSDILFHLIEQRDYIDKALLMIQKEVAERLVSPVDKKTYGITTAAVNLVGSCRKLFDVKPESFYPVPKVTSSIIELTFNKIIDDESYYSIMKLVKTAFNQRRKQLRNSLKSYINDKLGDKSQDFYNYYDNKKSMFLNKRPENLSVMDFMDLNEEITNFK